ncbi:MAG: 3'(2'),5'-bisphosphate nucleotidase CysQ [Myxococcota bacterium]|jgi:3'(2'), 5'-bisphosphate nucleotidase|nr:3'(2'),5'-bisphosphate nucleotidase CysQ [Myxococcota bacterium]
MTDLSLEYALLRAIRIARSAAPIALRYFRSEHLDVVEKPDEQGPVTVADKAMDAFLREQLGATFPADAIISEEHEARRHAARTWYVDPIDGTQSFVDGSGDFSVMIALFAEGELQLGVVHRPYTAQTFFAQRGVAAFLFEGDAEPSDAELWSAPRLRVSERRGAQSRAIMSASHPCVRCDAFFDQLGVAERRTMGSMGSKICEIARGASDIYLNLSGKPSLWDVAAGELILREAGGHLLNQWGEAVDYGREQTLLGVGVLACNDALRDDALLLLREFA